MTSNVKIFDIYHYLVSYFYKQKYEVIHLSCMIYFAKRSNILTNHDNRDLFFTYINICYIRIYIYKW